MVLPTGTGKTETMLATLVSQSPVKLLVLVPSDVLRSQIGGKFETLGLLRKLGHIPPYVFNPKVGFLKSGIHSLAEAKNLVEECNVIIALPHTLAACGKGIAELICSSCDQIFVDEAHHVSASSWQRVVQLFENKKIVQFTATPFRNDRKHIGGKIIFNYKLSDAQADNYYKKIRLEAVEEFGTDNERDRAIAHRAIEMLRADRQEEHLDHLLLARVRNANKAKEILELYQELAPEFNPVAVYSDQGKTRNDLAFAALRDQSDDGAKIVVCVNMLGEGFDLPELKIAAVHDNHKSLAITLQFVGRFTRQGENVKDAAVVINIADANAEKRLEELFSQDADWDQLISRLSENQIESELALQDVVESLKSAGDLHDHISLWNLHPALSTQVYRTACENWSPLAFKDAFPENAILWHSLSEERHILVVVSYQEAGVKWGRYENLTETSYNLMIVYWDSENSALFIHASDYDRMRTIAVAQCIGGKDTSLLSGPKVFNVLNNVELPLAKSLGSSRIGAISFTSYFGPNVTEGLANIEKSDSELSHIACLGYEDGEKVLWGTAQKKAKIWQHTSGSIDDWVLWCNRVFQKLSDDDVDASNITKDFLRPEKLLELPPTAPISIQWGEYLQTSFSDYVAVLFGDKEVPLYLCEVGLVEQGELDHVSFDVQSDEFKATFEFRIDPSQPKGYRYDQTNGPKLSFRVSKQTVREFDDQMYIDPFIIRYADGTYSYNNFHIPFDLHAGEYAIEKIEAWDWEDIPLNQESMGPEGNADTIQHHTFDMLKDDYDLIFNDDGPGEAGDLVAFRDIGPTEIELSLIHCKNAHGGKVSGDIRNLYTLCGQAQKCISVKHEGIKKLAVDLRRRQENWVKRGASRILKGDLKKLAYFVEKARRSTVKFEVIIVQPGISKSAISNDMARLLATTEVYLKRTTEAEFRVVTSS